jgi:hypothetical protein
MPGLVYLLCAATSFLCAVLLLRGFARTGVRLLLFSGICFVGFTIDNFVLYLDLIVIPEIDISLVRRMPGLIALVVLLFGLVWESK